MNLLRAATFALVSALLAGATLADEAFTPGFHCNGVDGIVYCVLAHEGDLYVGGSFPVAGDVCARNIARWDGQQWHALGPGLDGWVRDLSIFEGDLVACGDFIHAGDLAVNQIARWDGAAWHDLTGGISDDPYDGGRRALAVYDGSLWCDGYRWYTTNWTYPLRPNGWVHDLEVVDDMLVMAGDFTEVNNFDHENVVGYRNGTRITMPGMTKTVLDLEVHDGQMHALREWRYATDPPPVAVWNGSGWDDLGDIVEVDDVDYRSLLSHDGVLHLMGIEDPPGLWSTKIATWNGVAWNWDLGARAFPGVSPTIIANHPDGIVLAGRMGACGETTACGLVLLTGDEILALGPPGLGVNGRDTGPVWGMTATPDGLVICGTFEGVGQLRSDTVALFDGAQWISRDMGEQQCHMTTWYHDQLHAFPRTGEESYPQQAIWNGAGWDYHDAGTEIWATSSAIVWQDRLLIAGTDLTDWSVPGEPTLVAELTESIGLSLVRWGDGYAVGGAFTAVDGMPAERIAIYDGETWSCPGGGMNLDVYALIEFEGRLVAGGRFTSAGGVPAQCVAAWDGATWEPLGDGLASWVNAFAIYRGELYAAGRFMASGGTPIRRLARWSEGQWHEVGGGTDRTISDMAVFDDRLYVSGEFHTVGDDLPSCRLAVWDGDVLLPVGGLPRAERVRLAPPAPNPFNPSTRISFTLGRDGWTSLQVHDLRGRLVATLVDEARPAGEHSVVWDGRDRAGRRVASGNYLLRLAAGGEVTTAKVALVE